MSMRQAEIPQVPLLLNVTSDLFLMVKYVPFEPLPVLLRTLTVDESMVA